MYRIISVLDVRAINPCTDPREYVPEEWQGTLLDILKLEQVPVKDRIWVVTNLLDDKTNRLFAVWCARKSFKLQGSVDPRSLAACDVAERYANGEATAEELSAAWSAAESAAWSAAESAARSAARSAAWSAAESAARSAQLEKLKEIVKDLEGH